MDLARAGSFPQPEAFPYVSIHIGYRIIVRWDDWIFGIPLPVGVVPVITVTIDMAPWTVSGTHEENTGDGKVTIRSSYATGCNWGDTFNSMGD